MVCIFVFCHCFIGATVFSAVNIFGFVWSSWCYGGPRGLHFCFLVGSIGATVVSVVGMFVFLFVSVVFPVFVVVSVCVCGGGDGGSQLHPTSTGACVAQST